MPKIEDINIDGLNIYSITPKAGGGGLSGPTDSWQLVALAQILVELKKLNSVLQCPNFIAVPAKLDRIERNTRKRRKRRAVAKPALRLVR